MFIQVDNRRWIINVRGVANVISSKGTQNVVYGFLYTLSQADEAKLNRYEGFPHIYGKKILPVSLLTRPNPTTDGSDLGTKEEHLNALVYVDVERTDEGDIREEYIGRMRLAIADALGEGIPPEYIDKYIGKWVPILES
ncbi:hypothetical protein AMATHDRAFT_46922 [Amanita thiersii Skay4041]|uniref:Gamma-glutamylcyclotransferase n=1 Tax=Amanita thiersii Skay4041 TaxID=703135 RepID=A0A2A9NU05_9AGAR|nr:hypothetical protein AMATHDRAFT_46922 [Amanita thiersii Skay4041]